MMNNLEKLLKERVWNLEFALVCIFCLMPVLFFSFSQADSFIRFFVNAAISIAVVGLLAIGFFIIFNKQKLPKSNQMALKMDLSKFAIWGFRYDILYFGYVVIVGFFVISMTDSLEGARQLVFSLMIWLPFAVIISCSGKVPRSTKILHYAVIAISTTALEGHQSDLDALLNLLVVMVSIGSQFVVIARIDGIIEEIHHEFPHEQIILSDEIRIRITGYWKNAWQSKQNTWMITFLASTTIILLPTKIWSIDLSRLSTWNSFAFPLSIILSAAWNITENYRESKSKISKGLKTRFPRLEQDDSTMHI